MLFPGTVIWSVLIGCSACITALFRYRRMFSLESDGVIWFFSREFTAPAVGRYHECGEDDHDFDFIFYGTENVITIITDP